MDGRFALVLPVPHMAQLLAKGARAARIAYRVWIVPFSPHVAGIERDVLKAWRPLRRPGHEYPLFELCSGMCDFLCGRAAEGCWIVAMVRHWTVL